MDKIVWQSQDTSMYIITEILNMTEEACYIISMFFLSGANFVPYSFSKCFYVCKKHLDSISAHSSLGTD